MLFCALKHSKHDISLSISEISILPLFIGIFKLVHSIGAFCSEI